MSSDPEDVERSAIIEGSVLADALVRCLEDTELSSHDRVLLWIGVFARLRIICDQQLGHASCDDVLKTAATAHHQQRAQALS
jgi:hypothetical protein